MSGLRAAFSRHLGLWLVSSYLVAFVILLVCFVLTIAKFPEFLYVGRDGQYVLWVSNAYRKFAGAFDVTAINPYEGVVTTLIPINPYFDPGQWVFWLHWPYGVKLIASYAVYLAEVAGSTFALGLALGFGRPFSLIAAVWLCLLLFPPFNFFFALQGYLATAPIYGHLLGLSNLILVAYTCIGRHGDGTTGIAASVLRNILLIAAMFACGTIAMLAAPFYNAGMLIGTAIFGIILLFSSMSRRQFLWRCGAAIATITAFWGFGLLNFYRAEMHFSDRIGSLLPQFHFHWPVGGFLADFARSWTVLCNWGIACRAFPDWPLQIGSYWLHAAIIMGGVALWRRGPRPLSRIGLFGAGAWLALLVLWGVASLGFVALPFSPVYFFLMLYPLLGFLSLFALVCALRLAAPVKVREFVRLRWAAFEASAVIAGACALLIFGFQMKAFSHHLDRIARNSRPPPETVITELLKHEVGFGPGQPFRGSVATVFGGPGGTFRPVLGLTPQQPMQGGQIEDFRQLAARSGSSYDLLDLWRWNIPTLSEYGQGVSRQLMFYMTNFLSSPGDPRELDFAIPRVDNTDVLRALGVRFLVTDSAVAGGATLRQTVPLGGGAVLHLYELPDPNLGDYSPTRLRHFTTAAAFIQAVRRDPDLFATEAFVAKPGAVALTPARQVQMIFEKGGIHVTGSSAGVSAVLLPVQFSHCYRLAAPLEEQVTIERANLIQTLLIFDKQLDAHLRWRFRFPEASACRMQDVRDLEEMNVS